MHWKWLRIQRTFNSNMLWRFTEAHLLNEAQFMLCQLSRKVAIAANCAERTMQATLQHWEQQQKHKQQVMCLLPVAEFMTCQTGTMCH